MTFLFAPVALRRSAVLAALAARATPPFFVVLGLLGSAAFALEAAVAALRPPRFGFVTVVPFEVVEASVEALRVLLLRLTARSGDDGTGGLGGGSIWPLVVVVVAFSLDAVRVNFAVAAVPRFACSSIPCTEAEIAEVAAVAADLNGEVGFIGDMAGRAIMLLAGEVGAAAAKPVSLTGDRG